MPKNLKLNYVEFPAKDIPATKKFFEDAFGWSFKDYGPDYTSFADEGLDGGFYKSDLSSLCIRHRFESVSSRFSHKYVY